MTDRNKFRGPFTVHVPGPNEFPFSHSIEDADGEHVALDDACELLNRPADARIGALVAEWRKVASDAADGNWDAGNRDRASVCADELESLVNEGAVEPAPPAEGPRVCLCAAEDCPNIAVTGTSRCPDHAPSAKPEAGGDAVANHGDEHGDFLCPCPHHPAGCFDHPNKCGCANKPEAGRGNADEFETIVRKMEEHDALSAPALPHSAAELDFVHADKFARYLADSADDDYANAPARNVGRCYLALRPVVGAEAEEAAKLCDGQAEGCITYAQDYERVGLSGEPMRKRAALYRLAALALRQHGGGVTIDDAMISAALTAYYEKYDADTQDGAINPSKGTPHESMRAALQAALQGKG